MLNSKICYVVSRLKAATFFLLKLQCVLAFAVLSHSVMSDSL